MDVGQIEALVQVAQHQSFSKAAESLYLTQPSVTARIQALEKELAEELFERTGRGVRLTDAGHAFLPFAERILAVLQEGRESVEEVRSLQIGSLRLGVAPTLCTYVLPRTLKAFRNRYPDLEVTIRTGRSEQILALLLNDEVQVGLCRSLYHPDVETIPLYADEIILVANPQHPLATRSSVALEEMSRQPVILYDRGSGYYALTASIFREAGIVPHLAMELDYLEATKRMVEEGLGIALVPRVAVERELELGVLREVSIIDAPPVNRQIGLLYKRRRKLNRVAQAFVDFMAEHYDLQLLPQPPGAVASRRRRWPQDG
ncbi:MAG TPA: LysR family transcriptional regulator [Dehalococcoidia bacterium]|nr:LysR family transcriptional regulator [Dehalococcoidia bacterium]HLB28793.1 LysR family transcriptional regulator [Dehalococcoidia bacterium]